MEYDHIMGESQVMDEFNDQVVLITGAGRGLGQELAVLFSSLGARVAANDINPVSLDKTVDRILKSGGEASPYVFDIAKRMPIEAMVAQVLEHYGRIDILINHARVEPDASILEMDEWEFHRTMDVNLGGYFFTTQQVGRVMRQQGAGTIVNLISNGGRVDIRKGRATQLASQAGLIGLTRAAARELITHHIRVNAVFDGQLDVGFVPFPELDFTTYQHWWDGHPELKLCAQSAVLSLVVFVCSRAASSLTGQILSPLPGI